jgi:hypothetical protein
MCAIPPGISLAIHYAYIREPAENIPFLESHYAAFDAMAQREGKDARRGGVILLDEAKHTWDEQAHLKVKRSARYIKMGWPLLDGHVEDDAEAEEESELE